MGTEEENIDFKAFEDSPEVVAKHKEEFRAVFADFANDQTTIPKKVELLQSMQEMVLAEKMLPLGITRDDIVKGVRSVKFDLGCVKKKIKEGDCKVLEKQYIKLLATIDRVNDRTIVSNR